MTNFTIPFFGDEIEVHFVKNAVVNNGQRVLGYCVPGANIIYVSLNNFDGRPLKSYQIKTTIAHELTHIFLQSGEYSRYSNNEPLVEWLAKCIVNTFGDSNIFNKQ